MVSFRDVRKFLWGMLSKNIVAKIMALAMALALWLYAYSFSSIPARTETFRLQVLVPAGWAVVSESAPDEEVTFKYPRRVEAQVEQALQNKAIRLEARVSPDEAGNDEQPKTVELQPANLIAPAQLGITTLRFSRPTLDVTIVREATRALRVIPRLSAPPPGYVSAYAPYPLPATVTVRGRKDMLANATGIETEMIEMQVPPPVSEWRIEPRVALAPYIVVDGKKIAVSVEPETVTVRIQLTLEKTERTFENVPINVLAQPDFKYAATLPRERAASVTVRGPEATVRDLKSENVMLFVNVNGLEPREVPYYQRIEYELTGAPGAADVYVIPAIKECAVKIATPAP